MSVEHLNSTTFLSTKLDYTTDMKAFFVLIWHLTFASEVFQINKISEIVNL